MVNEAIYLHCFEIPWVSSLANGGESIEGTKGLQGSHRTPLQHLNSLPIVPIVSGNLESSRQPEPPCTAHLR